MKNVVLATAGHIDHGKTALTHALTGIDTDRLPEEKERGITIDLGFAHCVLGDARVAFIDVPGHERFVKNMLAGVGSVDLALLVVAGDESVMPQTREHVAILDLLGVPDGIVALTKSDVAGGEMLEIVRLEVAELTHGTFLERAPVVAVSARTGDGIDDLRMALEQAVGRVTEHDAGGPFRLHVDRAFTVKGFGSVVTGTVDSGRVAVGDEVEISPSGTTARVRGIEVHGAEVGAVQAGARAALNLQGIDLASLERGFQLVPPRLFRPATLVDARIRMLADSGWELKDLMRVRVHLGATEVLARVKLLDVAEGIVQAGGEGLAQLRLERPVLALPGDRFIVRSYSPSTTIGGGVVLDLPPQKHRGTGQQAAKLLHRLETQPASERPVLLVEHLGGTGLSVASLVERTGSRESEILAALSRDEVVRIEGASSRFFHRDSWARLKQGAIELLKSFHAREPLRDGMSREELRARVLPDDAPSARRLIDDLASSGLVRLMDDRIALAAHRVELSDAERRAKEGIEQAFARGGLNAPAVKDVLQGQGAKGENLLRVLVREGVLVGLPGGLYFHRVALDALLVQIRARSGETMSVARFKELTGTSRKYAIPLLEHLDSLRVTRRAGDDRIVN